VAELTAPLFKSDGTSAGEISLDPEVFGIEPNLDVVGVDAELNLVLLNGSVLSPKGTVVLLREAVKARG